MYRKLFFISTVILLLAFYLDSTLFNSILSYLSLGNKSKRNVRLFTIDELKQYNGVTKPELYLAILGNVFDVSKGSKHYGPGESYNFFVGRDASRSFITGKFTEDDVDDKVTDLSNDELRSLDNWVKFYAKEYKKVGKLVGRYYDQTGKLTRYGKEVKKLIKEAEKALESQNLENIKHPPCNVEWDADRGTRVWCTDKSGGISRDWVGFPRQLYEPGSQDYRCACVESPELNGNLKEYEGCDPQSVSCYVK